MKDTQEWLKSYGLIPKIILVLFLFVWLGGLNAILFISEDYPDYESTLDSLDRPPGHSNPKYENWDVRRQKAKISSDAIVKRATAKGDAYSIIHYFRDYNALMDVEDEQHISLRGFASPAL